MDQPQHGIVLELNEIDVRILNITITSEKYRNNIFLFSNNNSLIRHHRYILQEDAIYTCEAYDARTANVPNGNNLKDRICKNECTRKEVEVYVAETLKETCQGVVGRIFLPPTKMVFYMHQYKHILDM